MVKQTKNSLAQYYVKCWVKEFVKFNPGTKIFNKDLVKSCNDFIKNHLRNLGSNPDDDEIFIYIKTIRCCLTSYFEANNLLNNINFRYHHHSYGNGIKGIYIANPIEHEELILKNIRQRIYNDFSQKYFRKDISNFVFNQPYKIDYYSRLKHATTQLPKYFFSLFQLHQFNWKNTYHQEFNKLTKLSNLRWYKQKRKFDRLFPSSYGINTTYPRYKIYPTYGTIISLPSQLRQNILTKLNKSGYAKFYTIDFVACHLNIIVGLFQQQAPTCYKLLKQNLFWTTIIDTIRVQCKTIINSETHAILSDDILKLILKKFIYKKLQGGNIKNITDIYTSLNANLQKALNNDFQQVAQCIQTNIYIKEIEKITKVVNSKKIIYTPENLKGYAIRAKRQRISRLATGIEICLLLHLILIIIQLPENIIPISLEHDGILLYGKCNNVQQYIQKINSEISKYSNRLIQHPITVELKA